MIYPITEPYPEFTEFYNHEFIKSIENNKKWSISDKDKRPIDMPALIYDYKIFGASMLDGHNPCISLPKLKEEIPNAANHAYYLNALIDNFVVLDIEPKCPADIRDKLLKTAYIYGEYSLSGKGYHLIYPLPDCIKNYPIAQKKMVMKEEHGYYEILLNHWVTFTRNMLPPSEYSNNAFEKLFEKMAKIQKQEMRIDIELDDIKPENVPDFDYIINILRYCEYKKTPIHFNGDMSRFEYGCIGFFHNNLNRILSTDRIKKLNHEYTPNEKAWMLYIIAQEKIPHRDKHDLYRNNCPWLLYLAGEIVAKNQIKSDNMKGN